MIDLHNVVCGVDVVYCEHKVARLAAWDADGRLIVDTLLSADKARQWAETDAGKAILEALRRGPLTGAELSKKSGFSGGWYRTVRQGLITAGAVVKDGDRYKLSADD